jgi:phosphonate transport system permease protein
VLGLVGGGGIGYLLIQYMNLLQFNQAATVLWLIVIVVTAMDYASAAIRARLV